MIDVSPCTNEADELLSIEAYNRVWPHDAVGLPEVRSFKTSLVDHADLVARADGDLAGSGFAAIQPQRPNLVMGLITVLEEHRRRGVGTALYGAISDWAGQRGLDTIEVVVADDDPESLAFAERRGFTENRREPGVALDLTSIPPPQPMPPPGVEILTWAERPELARGIYEVAVEASRDIPGSEDEEAEPFDDWLAHDMQGAGDRPEATFVAVAGDEVIGYAKFSLSDAQPTTAHHDLTAVRRAWRGRGVARALKASQIAWAKANGYRELRTRNEQRNAPIRHLNAEFGYRPTVGRIYLLGPLSGAVSGT